MLGFISFSGGFLANYYQEYRSDYLTGLRKNHEDFKLASHIIDESLVKLSKVALGEKPKNAEDVDILRDKLRLAVNNVRELSRRIDDSLSVATAYEEAALKLVDAADAITGPYDGKPMVEAISNYYVAQQDVEMRVVKEDTKFIK